MVKGNSQMFIIGGQYPNSDMCDLSQDIWGQYNLWTGTVNFSGSSNLDVFWATYNPNLTTDVVPEVISDVIGGSSSGGATLLTPKGGYDDSELGTLLLKKASFSSRTATRDVSAPTSVPTSDPTSGPSGASKSSSILSAGAIAGIAIGGVVAFALICLGVCLAWKGAHAHKDGPQAPVEEPADDKFTCESPTVYASEMLGNVPSPQPPPTEMEGTSPRELPGSLVGEVEARPVTGV